MLLLSGIYLFITTVSVILQVYTIWLISPKQISEYRWFLLKHVVSISIASYYRQPTYSYGTWDMAFTTSIGAILEPHIYPPVRGVIVRGFARFLGRDGPNIAVGGLLVAGGVLRLTHNRGEGF